MYKKSLYPKTKRVSSKNKKIEITEKLDGSNLGIFRKGEDLYIAQRNYIFCWNKIEESGSSGLYKGLYGWLKDNAEEIHKNLYDGSGIVGEWLGMGKISYGFKDRFFAFAKGRLDGDNYEDFVLSNIVYSQELIPWAFAERNVPECVKLVPIVQLNDVYPTKEELDELYKTYSESLDRKCEGLIINQSENIQKYIRYKDGKLTEHKESGE